MDDTKLNEAWNLLNVATYAQTDILQRAEKEGEGYRVDSDDLQALYGCLQAMRDAADRLAEELQKI